MAQFPKLSFPVLIVLAIVLRVGLILYSQWHDAHNVVKYTDIDYIVYTDASRFLIQPSVEDGNIAKGPLGSFLGFGDPYHRPTYRYTPLLALLLAPNLTLHPSFGKYVFAACDLFVAAIIRVLLKTTILPDAYPSLLPSNISRKATLLAAIHLFNPMVFSISTRGSSESIINLLVVATLYYAMTPLKGRTQWNRDITGIMLGLAVHWKLYPVIYGFSLLAAIAGDRLRSTGDTFTFTSWFIVKKLFSREGFRLAFVSFTTFMALNASMYLIWGYPFLYETYLYHFHRIDDAHNFSVYWYINQKLRHLAFDPSVPLHIRFAMSLSPFTSFVPQMIMTVIPGLYAARGLAHIPYVWFLQTMAFVTFNKVCTSQYFLWYLTLLPLFIPFLRISFARTAVMVGAWIGTQALWLKYAYELEFLGRDEVKGTVWALSIVFLVVNAWEMVVINRAYVFERPVGTDGTSKTPEAKKTE